MEKSEGMNELKNRFELTLLDGIIRNCEVKFRRLLELFQHRLNLEFF